MHTYCTTVPFYTELRKALVMNSLSLCEKNRKETFIDDLLMAGLL